MPAEPELCRTVGQQQPTRARVPGGRQRLVDTEVPARLAVVVPVVERRLADEQVAVAGKVGETLARAAVPE